MVDEKNTKQLQNVDMAEKKMEKIILEWFMSEPMMLEAINMFEKIPSKDQHTIGIDTSSKPPVIKFNPNFINAISNERLECVMAIEGFKILLNHVTTRLCKPMELSGLASNITIAPFTIHKVLDDIDRESFYPNAQMFGLKPNRCFEEYFRVLMDRRDETQEKIKKIWGSMSQEEKEQALENATCICEEENDFMEFEDSQSAMKEYFDPNSTNSMDWGECDLLKSDINNVVDDYKHKSGQWGTIGRSMIDQILSARTPKISWKELLRRFNRSVISMRTYPSRMKLNRRYGLMFPGQRRDYDTEIIYAIDSSGSMCKDDLAEGFAVVNSMCGKAKITYLLFDTKITDIETDFKKAKDTFKVTGRGGTNFQEVIDYANTHKADGLIIFTDGEAPCPTQPLKTKVLWLLHSKNNGYKPPHGCTWGDVAYLERFE